MNESSRLDLCAASKKNGYCKKCRCFVSVQDGEPLCSEFNGLLDQVDPDSGEFDWDRE